VPGSPNTSAPPPSRRDRLVTSLAHRRIGRSELSVFPLALGAMNFGDPTPVEESFAILSTAVAAGIDLIDVADVYNNGRAEEIVGEWIATSGVRDELVIATKVGMAVGGVEAPQTHSRRHIEDSCDASLRRLRTDRIDLYQLHKASFDVPVADLVGVFDGLIDAGKIRSYGLSSHPATMIREFVGVAGDARAAAPISEQPPYNLLDRRIEREVVPAAVSCGVGLLAWSPLGGGLLAGRYAAGQAVPNGSRAQRKNAVRDRVTAAAIDAAAALDRLAVDTGLTSIQLSLAWVRDRPGVVAPIVGPRTVGQLHAMLSGLDVTLDDDVLAHIDLIVEPRTAVSDFYNTSGWSPGPLGTGGPALR